MTENLNKRTPGIVISCNQIGIIERIVFDSLGFDESILVGQHFETFVDQANREKARNFLMALVENHAAFDWELNVPQADDVITLQFAGLYQDEYYLIVGARNGSDAEALFKAFMLINNEQTNALRTALKEVSELSQNKQQRDSVLYDELSRLNNQLMNMQRELAKKNAELASLNELKNSFLGMAAHDLRNPLGVIIGYTDFVLQEAEGILSEEHLSFLRIVSSSSEFMLRLVEDFLDVSVIESGKLRLSLEPVNLTQLIERNVTLNRTLADNKQIDVAFKPHYDPSELLLDRSKIDQVLNNLISNAIKYSHSGTMVLVELSQKKAVVQPDQASPAPDSYAIISVTDQGQGIPETELDKLFKMFSTTTVRSTAGEKSSGLGLAIAKRIIEAHEGTIWATSQEDVGSTFYIELPFTDTLT